MTWKIIMTVIAALFIVAGGLNLKFNKNLPLSIFFWAFSVALVIVAWVVKW